MKDKISIKEINEELSIDFCTGTDSYDLFLYTFPKILSIDKNGVRVIWVVNTDDISFMDVTIPLGNINDRFEFACNDLCRQATDLKDKLLTYLCEKGFNKNEINIIE